ncbi:hypothetical protein BD311DRAFT_735961 [Dichomitus squalens]|uniref:Uncharacterized protein n=1 Tax=Dichomitus squalens TaxID=114155 RepID=A0A4Q9N1N3_9APHY|nr:hypothetical protein BD311DRAFT_735961 [Dichomitus squalens]
MAAKHLEVTVPGPPGPTRYQLWFIGGNEVGAFLMEAFQSASELPGRFSGRGYHKPEIDALKQNWANLQDDEERARFKDDKAAFVTENRKVSCKDKRSEEVYKLKKERLEAIEVRPRQEGFGEVLNYMQYSDLAGLKRMSSVNRPSKLTEKGTESGWNLIRTSIVQYMTPFRNKYIREQAEILETPTREATPVVDPFEIMPKTRLEHFESSLDVYHRANSPRTSSSDCQPGFFELATLPVMQAALLQDTSSDVSWTLSSISHSSPLSASAVIHGNCAGQISLPIDAPVTSQENARNPSMSYAPYRGEELGMFDDHVAVTHAIISLGGFAPDTATHKDVEEAGISIGKRQVFNWQNAILHTIIDHPTEGLDIPSYWERLSPDDAVKAKALESALTQHNSAITTLFQNPLIVFGCEWCRWHGSIADLDIHLLSVHRILIPAISIELALQPRSKK